MRKVLAVFGTRPEVIKLVPVVHALRSRPDEVDLTLCSTGQHRELLDQTLAAFGVNSDIDLAVMRSTQTPADVLARVLTQLQPVLQQIQPHIIMAQGDTITVAAAALAGALAGCEVAHVEAGLRTGDKRAPFPEELCRRLTSVTADYHFVPTTAARQNLLREAVPPNSIFLTGNTVIDALRWMRARALDQPLPAELNLDDRPIVLVTAHRRENFGQPFRSVCEALRDIARQHQEIQIVYPVHLNPNVQAPVRALLDGQPNIRLLPPQPYTTFVALLARAHLILTDSGGIQEEVTALGTPTLVFREKTERPEAVASGLVHLVGTERDRIVHAAHSLLASPQQYHAVAGPREVYGDGRAGLRIAEVLCRGSMTTPEFQAASDTNT